MLEGNPFADLVPAGGFTPPPPERKKPEKPNLPVGYELGPDGVARRIPGLPAEKDGLGGTDKVTESERTAAFLTTNLLGATNQLAAALKTSPDAAKPTLGQEAAGLFGATARGAANTPARRQVEAAQLIILDNALTLGTGAAYTKEQLENYRQSYFPTLTDDEATIRQKQQSLSTLLASAKIKAGNQAGQIDEAMKILGLDPEVTLTNGGGSLAPAGETPKGKRLTPEQEAEYRIFLRGKPDAGALNSWWEARGFPGLSNAEEVAEALRTGKPVDPGINYSVVDEAAEQSARDRMAAEDKVGGRDKAASVLTRQGMTLGLTDEASGVGGALASALTGNNPLTGYTLSRDAERLRIADARQQLGGYGTAIEIGSGLLSANPTSAIAPATNVLATIAQGAKAGATGGALAGFGYGDGFTDSAEKAVVGGALGGALGGGLSAISTRMSPRGMAPEIAAAAEAERVRLIRPMVDPASRGKAGSLEATAGGQNIIREGVRGVSDDIEAATGRLATGTAQETGAAGERVQGAARRFIQRSKGVADRLYARARNKAGDTAIIPDNAIEQADAELAILAQNPETNAAEIAFVNRIRDDLSDPNGKSVDALRGIRTTLRGAINEANLTATQAEARVHRILDAAHRDLNLLPDDAATAFRRADIYYRERMEHIDDVTRRFLGPKDRPLSGEQAFSRLKSMASPGGDGRRLAAMWRDLSTDEQADVASTIAQSLGRRGPDEPFSTALFVSQARKLSPSARRTIFGPSGADSINNLVTLSKTLNEATADFNRSNSARVGIKVAARAFVAGLIGGGGGLAAGGSTAAAGGALGAAALVGANAGRNALSARALMSPRVSKWLAEAANVNTPAQAETLTRRLSTIIAREPALAGELTPIQQALQGQMRPSPSAYAESGENDEGAQ